MGQKIWIIGSSTGIGRELALQYAEEGKEVVISARSADTLAEVAGIHPDRMRAVPIDVTDTASIRAAVETLYRDGAGPDIVILGAGAYQPMSVDHFSSEKAAKIMEVNYLGVVRVIEQVLPHFKKAGAGHFVAIASVAGYQGLPLALAYGPSKAALINLSEALRTELSGSNILIQVVNPGFVKTPLTEGNKFPMPFLMEADDAARRIRKGIDGKAFEIAFPRRFAFILKFIRMLPYALSIPLIRKGTNQ
ncbi:MAG: oxidoreductase [Sneathiella sp.]|uniref:SDR family NAD(P)-dependent oxidoreductase n=1 Tax=Sneathiella sp. TaxID=1964365 RepID=UPI000C53A554|nr:SDR family NAD(P)-dependent oxidoreductase [Sneathiella sp.]MAZ04321.1 oxidoreductase [Sneathiella sp.]